MKKKARAREIGTNRRSLTGHVTVNGDIEPFESSLERDFLTILDFDPVATNVQAQPFSIHYEDLGGVTRRYTPDVMVEYAGYPTTIFEVKFREDLAENWPKLKAKFKQAIHICRKQGWQFRLVTEKEIRSGPMLKNIKFLRHYINREPDEGIEIRLLDTMKTLNGITTPESLLAAAYWTTEWRMKAVAPLWRLICTRQIRVNILEPLTMKSDIWLKDHKSCQNTLSLHLRLAR